MIANCPPIAIKQIGDVLLRRPNRLCGEVDVEFNAFAAGVANRLAAKLREIRSDEKNIYASVREYFKVASSNYDSASPKCRTFYATLQDKFHYAVTGQTASQILLDRADHKKPAMGIHNFEGNYPTISEAQIGKNYLDRDELYILHLLSEQFLLHIESKAIRNKKMTMDELSSKLDDLLKFNEYPVFKVYKDSLKDKAIKHAQAEYAMFLVRLKKRRLETIASKKQRVVFLLTRVLGLSFVRTMRRIWR